jgi:hypothetical protein
MENGQLIPAIQGMIRLLQESQLYGDYHPQKLQLLQQVFEQIELHHGVLEYARFREMVTWKITSIMEELNEIYGTSQYEDVEWIASGMVTQMLTVQNIITNLNTVNMLLEAPTLMG